MGFLHNEVACMVQTDPFIDLRNFDLLSNYFCKNL
jgi:hypothetical protein